jgi:hypothetical protein
MAEARRAARARRERSPAADAAGSLSETWRRLNFEQRVAAVAALLLIVSTFGPFSFVEAAIVLTSAGVLMLLKKRADHKEFHLPFGDGTVILAAGLWCGLLIVVRLFDRELGQSVLALVCAAILAGAGARERAKRPADDLPPADPGPELSPARPAPDPPPSRPPRAQRAERTARLDPAEDITERLSVRDAPTEERPRRNSSSSDSPPIGE